jgi:hypothetical protein
VVVVLVKTIAPSAAAEEPTSRCDACEVQPEAPVPSDPTGVSAPSEPASAVDQVPGAPLAETQGATLPNLDSPLPGIVPLEAAPPRPIEPKEPLFLGVRLPTFIAFGLGSLGVGGAVVARLAAAAPYSDPKLGCVGRCADSSHTLGMTSTILAGIAVAAVGTGVVLAVSEPAREKKPLAPVLKMSVSLSKAASASWTF